MKTDQWEHDTLAMIRHVLKSRPGSVHIDFGAWIGPTAIFASTYARKVFALEPDPSAFMHLYHNIAMNPAVSRNTEATQLCISDQAGSLTLHGELGNSESTILNYRNGKNDASGVQSVKVSCRVAVA